MNRKLLSKAFGDIDGRFVAEAYRPVSEDAGDASERGVHVKKKRLLTLALAAVLLLSLGAAAYAAGWFSPIFHSIRYAVPAPEERRPGLESYYTELEKKNAVLEAAEQYMNEQQPASEPVNLPELDRGKITLSERYYNGEQLLLGVNLDSAIPKMTVGYVLDDAMREKMAPWDLGDTVDLDVMLAEGRIEQRTYDEFMEARTEYAEEYGLLRQSALALDGNMKGALPPEEYEEAWRMLRETGHLCVVENFVFVSDGISMEDGTDLGLTYQENSVCNDNAAAGRNIYIEIPELTPAARNLDKLDILLKVRHVRLYYYMELGGPVYYVSEPVASIEVPFSIENAAAP